MKENEIRDSTIGQKESQNFKASLFYNQAIRSRWKDKQAAISSGYSPKVLVVVGWGVSSNP